MQENLTPKISIIIPIYNVENYLNQTLFSVVNQTLKEIEIICIEDCSTDNSPKILENFAKTDQRINIIYHEENMGVSISRKEGILASKGEYIMFLDGDDYLDITACKKLYHKIIKQRADMLQFGTTIVPNKDVREDELEVLKKILMPCLEDLHCDANGDLVNYCFVDKKFGFTLWNKIYRGDIVRKAISYYPNERFDLAEDLHTFFLIAFFSKRYVATEQQYYFYNFGLGITGNKMHSLTGFKNKIKQGQILVHLEKFTEKYDPIGITSDAIEVVKNQFISDVVYNFIWNMDEVEKKAILSDIFSEFNHDEILTELLGFYYDGNYEIQKKIFEVLKRQNIFCCTKNIVKTIGTFYHRIDNGGVERVISQLIPMWLSQGYQVVLFTDEIPSPTDYDYPDSVVRVILPSIKDNNKKTYKQRIAYLRDMLVRYNIDAMVYHAWISKYLYMDMLATKSLGIPFIVHTHSFFGQGLKSASATDAYQSILINKIYEQSDAIITLSRADYDWWTLRHKNVYRTINPLSFKLNDIKPAELKNSNILWIGRISPEKKPIDALKIIKNVIDSGYQATLHIVGKADNAEYYQLFLDKIAELNLGRYIILHGFHKDVSKFYKNASVYLHTSEFEGFSMTLVESKAYGIPAVIYDLPNLDIVSACEGMQVVEQGDLVGAAREIIKLLSDVENRLEMGKEARSSIEAMYLFDIPMQWKNILDSVIEHKNVVLQENIYERLEVAIEMMLDFSAKGIENREIERCYYAQQSDGGTISESDVILKEIYNMRTWKMIQKYRKFMDETWLGKLTSGIRDLIIKRR